MVNYFAEKGEVTGAMADQLANNAEQALHQYEIGNKAEAVKHIKDFIKHLNKEALKGLVSDSAKADMNTWAEAVISQLQAK